MAYAYRTATFDGEAAFDRAITVSGLTRLLRAIAANLVMAGAATATVGVVGAGVTLGALGSSAPVGVTSSQIHTGCRQGRGRSTLAGYDPAATGTIPNRFENTWTRVAGGRPLIIDVPDSPPRPVIAAIPAPPVPPPPQRRSRYRSPGRFPRIRTWRGHPWSRHPSRSPLLRRHRRRWSPRSVWRRRKCITASRRCPRPTAARRSMTSPPARSICRTGRSSRPIPASTTRWTIRASSVSACAGRRRRTSMS